MCFFRRFLNTLNSSAELSGYSDSGRISRHFPLGSRAGRMEIYLYLYIILSYIHIYIHDCGEYPLAPSWQPPRPHPTTVSTSAHAATSPPIETSP